MTAREHAGELVKYFTRLSKTQPADESWAVGRRLSTEWLALIETPDSSRVAQLLKDVEQAEALKDPGSGIIDLGMGIRGWAKSLKR